MNKVNKHCCYPNPNPKSTGKPTNYLEKNKEKDKNIVL